MLGHRFGLLTLFWLIDSNSAFTQRPWLQQLNVARTLARRSAQHIG